MVAITGRPRVSASERRVSTSAAAPSALALDEAGVTVPFSLKAAFSSGIFSGFTFTGFSSRATSPVLASGVPATLSASHQPFATAFSARARLSLPQPSSPARVTPSFPPPTSPEHPSQPQPPPPPPYPALLLHHP